MAEQHQPAASAAFPGPPPFYKYFTKENIARLKELKTSNEPPAEEIPPDAPAKPSPQLDITSLPLELRYLIPPPPPTGQYRSFGELHDASPLAPPSDPTALPTPHRLRDLLNRILLEFLALSQVMATDPGGDLGNHPAWAIAWDSLQAAFIAAHRVVNEYRPHQARETLIEMMEEQIRNAREEIRLCEEAKSKVREVLTGLGSVTEEAGGKEKDTVKRPVDTRKRKGEAIRESENMRIWQYLEREVGRVLR